MYHRDLHEEHPLPQILLMLMRRKGLVLLTTELKDLKMLPELLHAFLVKQDQ